MTEKTAQTAPTTVVQSAGEWLPVVLRLVVTVILLPAGILKFTNYSGEVAAFASYGIPFPEIVVPLVGLVELGAVLTILFGAAGRVGAVAMVPVMVTAMVAAGIVATNVIVLVGSVGIVLLGTGRYSVWQPAGVCSPTSGLSGTPTE